MWQGILKTFWFLGELNKAKVYEVIKEEEEELLLHGLTLLFLA